MKYQMLCWLLYGLMLSTNSLMGQSDMWYYQLDSAQHVAQMEDRLIFMVFSGSDWCRPCIQLEVEAWNSPAFRRATQTEIIPVKLDFPRKRKNRLSPEQTKYNESLAARYNPKGYFPYVLLLNAEGEVLGSSSYRPGGYPAFRDLWKAFFPQTDAP